MSDSPSTTQPLEVAAGQDFPELFEETLAHAQAGYENAQSVIKLIDAKAGVLIGLSTLSAGFLAAVFKWYVELDPNVKSGARLLGAFSNHPNSTWAMILGAKVSLLAGLVCIGACVWSVIARPRPANLKPFLVLFPYYQRRQEEPARKFFNESLRGMDRTAILAEYEDQLMVLGLILAKKLKHNRVASVAFLCQLVLLALALLILLRIYGL